MNLADLCDASDEIRDLGRNHPFLFHQKLGYVVTGVMPDANGRGLPDIYMSKRIGDGEVRAISSPAAG